MNCFSERFDVVDSTLTASTLAQWNWEAARENITTFQFELWARMGPSLTPKENFP